MIMQSSFISNSSPEAFQKNLSQVIDVMQKAGLIVEIQFQQSMTATAWDEEIAIQYSAVVLGRMPRNNNIILGEGV